MFRATKFAVILLVLPFATSETHASFGSFSGSKGTGGTTLRLTAFGDSITSAFPNFDPGYVGSFAEHASQPLAMLAQGSTIQFQAYSVSGHTLSQILTDVRGRTEALGRSDIVVFNGGGNDLIQAATRYRTTCSSEGLVEEARWIKRRWDRVLSTITAGARPDAVIRTMNVYYDRPDADREARCACLEAYCPSHFEAFLPILFEVSDYVCDTAEAAGVACVNAFSEFNCDQDSLGNRDSLCPTRKEHLTDGLHSVDHFRDPSSVKIMGTPRAVLYWDRRHPNALGHQLLGTALHQKGYGVRPAAWLRDPNALPE